MLVVFHKSDIALEYFLDLRTLIFSRRFAIFCLCGATYLDVIVRTRKNTS